MATEITQIIDQQGVLDTTPLRKRLLKTMADLRGNLAASARSSGYVTSGERLDREKFATLYTNFETAWSL
jgi:methyl-accepting chemotaxis protein